MELEKDAGDDGSDTNSSSGSMLEVKLNEYVKKSELTKLDIRALVVRCSSCGGQINHVYKNHVKKHRKLGVITCKDCYEYYGSSEFSQDENGLFNYCRWCGKGGKLIVCDFCPNAFCSACIRRNFGRSEISETEKDGWKCYCCDGTRLKAKQKFCNVIINFQKRDNKVAATKVKKENENTLSEKWLQSAFDNSNESCKTFHKKLRRLKNIGMAKSKSMKHVVSKMEQVINKHRTDLKNIVKSLSEQYSNYIELKRVEEGQINQNSNCLNGSDNSLSSPGNNNSRKESLSSKDECIIIEQETEHETDMKDLNNDCVIIEETPEKTHIINKTASSKENDKSGEKNSQVDEEADKVDEKTQAKLLLLQSSSDSDSHDQVSPIVEDSPSQTPPVVENDPIKNQLDANPSDSGVNARRTLTFDSDSTASSDFDTVNSKRRKSGVNKSRKSATSLSNGVKLPQINSDTKLKSQMVVEVERCDNLFKNGETTVKISSEKDIVDEENKLDKEILSLCRPLTVKKKSSVEQKTTSALPKSKTAPKVKEDSSSSISLSSDDEEDQITAPLKSSTVGKNATLKAKADLMASDSSSSDIHLESEEEEKSKKIKKQPQKKESDSSDDFQPRKRRKYDKLLDAPLLSDDGKDKKIKKKREKKTKKRKIMSSDEEVNEKSRPANSGTTSSTTSSDSEDELRKKSRKQAKKKRRVKTMDDSSSGDKDKQGVWFQNRRAKWWRQEKLESQNALRTLGHVPSDYTGPTGSPSSQPTGSPSSSGTPSGPLEHPGPVNFSLEPKSKESRFDVGRSSIVSLRMKAKDHVEYLTERVGFM